jgi:hypothetical protein
MTGTFNTPDGHHNPTRGDPKYTRYLIPNTPNSNCDGHSASVSPEFIPTPQVWIWTCVGQLSLWKEEFHLHFNRPRKDTYTYGVV